MTVLAVQVGFISGRSPSYVNMARMGDIDCRPSRRASQCAIARRSFVCEHRVPVRGTALPDRGACAAQA